MNKFNQTDTFFSLNKTHTHAFIKLYDSHIYILNKILCILYALHLLTYVSNTHNMHGDQVMHSICVCVGHVKSVCSIQIVY